MEGVEKNIKKQKHPLNPFLFSKLRKRVFFVLFLFLLMMLILPFTRLISWFIGTFVLFFLGIFLPFLVEPIITTFFEVTMFGPYPTEPIGFFIIYASVIFVYFIVAFSVSWLANFVNFKKYREH